MSESTANGTPRWRASFNPLSVAVGLTMLYVLLCGLYIAFSGRWAAAISSSIPELARIELVKGLGFVAATGVVFLVASFALLRRVAAQEQRLALQERVLTQVENRAMAGVFAASVAHDINNLLMIVHGKAALLADPARSAQVREPAVAALTKALDDLVALTKRLTAIGRERASEGRGPVDLADLVRKVVALASSHDKVRARRLEVNLDEPATLVGHASNVGRARV